MKTSKITLTVVILIGIFGLTGCSKMMGIGHEKSYCEENGIDYTDAGVCGDPMTIYKNRKNIQTNVKCKDI
jgi:hypothetical protein